jgi:hypothetical protein
LKEERKAEWKEELKEGWKDEWKEDLLGRQGELVLEVPHFRLGLGLRLAVVVVVRCRRPEEV